MPPSSGTVAVTGASGFIASHIIEELLRRGRVVHGTVRDLGDPEKTEHLRMMVVNAPGELRLFESDLLIKGSFDEAFSGCETVMHTAAVVIIDSPNPKETIVDPSVEGTRNVLESIIRVGGVRHLVHTSSVAAIRGGVIEDGRVHTESDWNDTSSLERFPYGLAKASAEMLAREFHANLPENGRFRYASINPSIVFGAPFTTAHSKGSNSIIWSLLMKKFPRSPKISVSVVDVRDVVAAHLNAMELDGDDPTRFILCGDTMPIRRLSEIGSRLYPQFRWPRGELPNFLTLLFARLGATEYSATTLKSMLGRSETYDNSLSREVLGIDYHDIDETFGFTVDSMLDRGFAGPRRR